jgi:hypothetical protein
MKKILRIVGRIFATILGVFLICFELASFWKVPIPSNAEAVGYDLGWAGLLYVGWLALSYGLGIRIVRTKATPKSS